MYAASSKASDGDGGGAGSPVAEEEQSFSSIRNSELYPHNSKVVGEGRAARWYALLLQSLRIQSV